MNTKERGQTHFHTTVVSTELFLFTSWPAKKGFEKNGFIILIFLKFHKIKNCLFILVN